MSQPQGTLYEIRWKEIFPWLILVRALRVSVMVRVLALAFAGVLLTQWGWSAVDMVFTENSARLEQLTNQGMISGLPDLDFSDGESVSQAIEDLSRTSRVAEQAVVGPLVRGWAWLAQPFAKLIDRDISWRRSLALLLSGSWTIVVWAMFGGAITRISAIYLTRGETLGPVEALKSALTKWGATAGGPFVVLLSVAAQHPAALVYWADRDGPGNE